MNRPRYLWLNYDLGSSLHRNENSPHNPFRTRARVLHIPQKSFEPVLRLSHSKGSPWRQKTNPNLSSKLRKDGKPNSKERQHRLDNTYPLLLSSWPSVQGLPKMCFRKAPPYARTRLGLDNPRLQLRLERRLSNPQDYARPMIAQTTLMQKTSLSAHPLFHPDSLLTLVKANSLPNLVLAPFWTWDHLDCSSTCIHFNHTYQPLESY